jgi:hypothetical protein
MDGLFKNAVSSQDLRRMMGQLMNDELERLCKEAVLA